VQTVDKSAANMTIDVTIEPGMRGELDPSKLSRLLQLIPTVSATFSQENCLAAVTAADIAVYGSLLPREGLGVALEMSDIVSGIVRVKRQKEMDDSKDAEDLKAAERSAVAAMSTAAAVVNMLVTIKIPEVALDLTYDPVRSRNLVLAVTTLEMQIIFRQADMQVWGVGMYGRCIDDV
jgi:hypothetical protein